MPPDVRIGLLVVGAVLLLAALLTLALPVPRTVRVLLGLLGVGLLAWGVTLQVMTPPNSSNSRSSSTAPAAPPPVTNSNSPATSTAGASRSGTAATSQAPARADLTLVASSAFSDCAKPADPAAPPDGNSATKAQMLAAQKAMKAYDASVTAYSKCIDTAAARIVTQYKGYAPQNELNAVSELDIKVHNEAFNRDTELVDQFNQQLRIFLARQHPNQGPLPTAP